MRYIEGLLSDCHLLERVKLEDLVLVALGLRPASQITLPAELPTVKEMGRRIDAEMKPLMLDLKRITEPRSKLASINALKERMRDLFEEIVENSEEYKAHYKWIENLGLRTNQVEVRPTVHELYIFKNSRVGKQIRQLVKERGRLRKKVMRNPSPDRGGLQLAYPEEFDGQWLRRMGSVLGYPECCANRYAEDRENGVNVEERASQQLDQEENVDPHSYFSSYFFPCKPRCRKALEQGYRFHEALKESNPRLGEIYDGLLYENMERTRRQPEIISRYISRAQDQRYQ